MPALILAGDVGGTKTVLSSYARSGAGLVPRREAVFASREHGSLEEILRRFLAEEPGGGIAAACFGVAGPVVDGRADVTNLGWQLAEQELARETGISRVRLVNDLEAMAHGVLGLPERERAILNRGARADRRATIAVLAAGTGLGQAVLWWDGERHRAMPSEGGHASFAPCDEEEIGLLRFLRSELGGHVSTERVLSGPGLHNVYRFLRERSGEPEPAWLSLRLAKEDPGAVVGEVGLAQGEPVCARAVERFASIYGAEAGNLALRHLALGGVMLGGGIAPKLLPALERGGFLRAFLDKGRRAPMLEGIEVSVALNPRAPLLGAASLAAAL
jgi:glucokinase